MRTQTETKKAAQFNLRENAEDKIIIVISFLKIYNPGLDI